jgi:hypothetical protein
MMYGNEDQSIVFFLSQNLEDFEEKTDDICVKNDGSEDKVIQSQLLIFASNNQLSINNDVDAVDRSEKDSNSHH